MLAMKIREICEENNIKADVESSDFASAQGKKADLIITIKQLGSQIESTPVCTVRSYVNKKKIIEDTLDTIKAMYEKEKAEKQNKKN